MISLRVKLAAYFLVLAMLPLAAAYWGFSSSARAGEENRANERLQTALRAGVASIQSELESAKRDALAVAADPRLHEALAAGDDRARRATRGWPIRRADPRQRSSRRNRSPRRARRGRRHRRPTHHRHRRRDSRLRRRLREASPPELGLERTDRVALVAGSTVAGAAVDADTLLRARPGQPFVTTLDPARYRALTARPVAGEPQLAFAVLTSQDAVDQALAATRRGLLIGVGASLLLIAIAAYAEARGSRER